MALYSEKGLPPGREGGPAGGLRMTGVPRGSRESALHPPLRQGLVKPAARQSTFVEQMIDFSGIYLAPLY